MMAKYFNVTGICIPEKHYMADISATVRAITETLVDRGAYFTINRARQYGKTTTLYLLEKKLCERYLVLSLSFEAADDLFVSAYTFAAGLVRRIGKKLSMQNIPAGILNAWNAPLSREFALEDFSDKITELCSSCEKGIVMMIDEVDKSSDNQIFLSFLGLLRAKYLEQQKGQDHTFQSVILAGVYDIKNLKLKIHPDEVQQYNSPWNIAADFKIEMSFSAEQIRTMLTEYEAEHHTGMDLTSVAQDIYAYTSGYPYLVSAICKYLDEEVVDAWTGAGILEAVKALLNQNIPLFGSMMRHISEYPALKDMLYAMLFLGEQIAYNPDHKIIDLACMFGYTVNDHGSLQVANRIFEMRLYNLFLSEEELASIMSKKAKQDRK